MKQDDSYRYYVAIFRCDVVIGEPFVVRCGDVKVELIKGPGTYVPAEYRPVVLAAVVNLKYKVPPKPPVVLDPQSFHFVLTCRTRDESSEAQTTCESAIDRVVALLSAISSTDLFRYLLFRGWLISPAKKAVSLLVRVNPPINIVGKVLGASYATCSSAIRRTPQLQDRFDLMARFVTKGLSEPPGEEAFIWLWTALEIFPMVNTTDIKPISAFLAGYVGKPQEVVKDKLRVGWLFGMRSKLVHDGRLPLDRDSRFSALESLERLVRAVVRHASGLPYDGSFDSELSRRG